MNSSNGFLGLQFRFLLCPLSLFYSINYKGDFLQLIHPLNPKPSPWLVENWSITAIHISSATHLFRLGIWPPLMCWKFLWDLQSTVAAVTSTKVWTWIAKTMGTPGTHMGVFSKFWIFHDDQIYKGANFRKLISMRSFSFFISTPDRFNTVYFYINYTHLPLGLAAMINWRYPMFQELVAFSFQKQSYRAMLRHCRTYFWCVGPYGRFNWGNWKGYSGTIWSRLLHSRYLQQKMLNYLPKPHKINGTVWS